MRVLVPISILVLSLAASAVTRPTLAADAFCSECISIRAGAPTVVRGPFADELDNHFVSLRMSDGRFRGFSANGASYAIDGPDLRAMGGPRHTVLEPGARGSAAECGRWLNGLTLIAGRLYGLVHRESDCDYDAGETHKSMAISVSEDEGATWSDLGTILSGTDNPTPGTFTGEGDCTMADGDDGFLYAYCLRNSDWRTIVARAPADDPRPGKWRKFFEGKFGADAIGGPATAIGFRGTASGFIRDFDRIATVAIDPWFKGLRLSLSSDKVTFTDLPMPLVPIDDADWSRPADTGLIAYVSLLNPIDGGNTVEPDFLIAYVYVPPGEDFSRRYLIFQEIHLTRTANASSAVAGVALTRWRGPDAFDRTTTAPVVNPLAHRDGTIGYLLTAAIDEADTVMISECAAGSRDYGLVAGNTCPPGTRRLGTVGFAYATKRIGSIPLYRCRKTSSGIHFGSSAADCEGGEAGVLLGYALAE